MIAYNLDDTVLVKWGLCLVDMGVTCNESYSKCPSCGGVVVLNPKTRQLQCTQCDSVISRGIGEENSAMTRNEDGELVDKRSYKAIQKIARIKDT